MADFSAGQNWRGRHLPETGYGLTTKGPNIKRLDAILEDLHSGLSERWGVNTRQNPESLLNHLLTNVADRIAELWELGEDVYYSGYPSSAEGSNLDNAAQYGGSVRLDAAPSYYRIMCTGIDGMYIPEGTIIASDTNPSVNLVLRSQGLITRSSFSRIVIKAAVSEISGNVTIALNGKTYTAIVPKGTNLMDAMSMLAKAIYDEDFSVKTAEDEAYIILSAKNEASGNTLVLPETLTTESVSSIILFATTENGDIFLPNGTITKIVKSAAGLDSVVNVGAYIAGRRTETDVEFRKSYTDRIFNRSSRMVGSIKSAIIDKVQGVRSVAVYENDTNAVDAMGRWPHSVEAVVDGGDALEIAKQILNVKAGGINTFGSVVVEIPGEYGENIPIRFNRPTYLPVWFRVGIVLSKTEPLATNYVDIIKDVILEEMDKIGTGDSVAPQRSMTGAICRAVSGIDYVDISMAVQEGDEAPDQFTLRTVSTSERERAITSANRVEVVVDGQSY